MNSIKKNLFDHVNLIIDARINNFILARQAAIESKNTETKSSAGDKFETGRAMMQLEQEKNEMHLSKSIQVKNILSLIDPDQTQNSVSLGALVKTNTGTYFIAVGLGKIKLHQNTYFVISLDSPIGQLLIGKTVGESATFRGKEISIQEIV